MLAQRIADSLSAGSLIRRMFEEGAKLRLRVGPQNVLDFSLGNPHLEPPPEFVERLQQLANHPPPGIHRYMPNPGFPDVRKKIADHLAQQEQLPFTIDSVIMTVGAACALNIALHSLINPGDNVIAFAPYFPEYRFYSLHAHADFRTVPTKPDLDLNLDALSAAIDARTRVILLNSPNNPTGRVYPEASIRQLADCLRDHSQRIGKPIVLIADEPYSRLVYDGVSVPSVFQHYDHTIRVVSFSKDLGLAGERIGYLALSPKLQDAAALMDGLIFCLRTLGFVNAPALMQKIVADILDASVDINAYKTNRDMLYTGLRDIGYETIKPEGAFFMFPKAPIADDRAFVKQLQEDQYLLAVPGSGFGGPGYFRLSYAVEPDIITRALPRFADAFKKARSDGALRQRASGASEGA